MSNYLGILIREQTRSYSGRPEPKPRRGLPCNCGLGVVSFFKTCIRCGGDGYNQRPQIPHGHPLFGTFVTWKGIRCEVDAFNGHTFTLVDCNTLEIYKNTFKSDWETP